LAITLTRYRGEEAIPYLQAMAELRMKIFHEFPYLYEGDWEAEKDYVQTQLRCPDSIYVIAFDGDEVVGASAALPLCYETEAVQKPFLEQHWDIQDVFYLAESVLDKRYRGQGLYREFFQNREQAAREYGCHWAAFCCVERQTNDPRRPYQYHPLDKVWRHFGYRKDCSLKTAFVWREIDEEQPTPKPMVFWTKKL